MRRSSRCLSLALFAAFVLAAASGPPAFAMPNYARETGVSCFSCHSQPARKLGAVDPLMEPDAGGVVYSVPVGEMKAGVSVHNNTTGFASLGSDGGSLWSSYSSYKENKVNDRNTPFTGLSGFVDGGSFAASLSLMRPAGGFDSGKDSESDLSLRYRLAFKPKLGGVDFAFGIFGTSKNSQNLDSLKKEGAASLVDLETYGLDARIGGRIGALSLNFMAKYMNARDGQFLKSSTKFLNDITDGFSAAARFGVNRKFGLSASYRTYKGKSGEENMTEDAASIGAWLNLSESASIESQYTTFGADRKFLTNDGVFTLLFITGF